MNFKSERQRKKVMMELKDGGTYYDKRFKVPFVDVVSETDCKFNHDYRRIYVCKDYETYQCKKCGKVKEKIMIEGEYEEE